MIRATKIKHYLKIMHASGFETEQVLANARINVDKLKDSHYLIDVWQAQKVIANIIELSDDSSLAFTITKDLSLPDLGILGYALMSCDSLIASTNLWLTYGHFLNGQMTRVQLEEGNNEWHVIVTELMPLDSLLSFCIEECLMYGKFIGETLLKTPYVFSKLCVTYSRPTHYPIYQQIFNCPVEFDAEVNRLTIASPSLFSPPQPSDTEFHDVCLQHCQRILEKITSKQPLAAQIREVFLKHKGSIPTVNEVACLLHMSGRSLRRHLKSEGVSYQQLVNGFRCDLAQEYLASTHFSNQEIGFLLGYQDTKAFLRAFKLWMGCTVSEYRATCPQKNIV